MNIISFPNTISEPTEVAVNPYNLYPVESYPISSNYGVIEGKKGIFVDKKNINIVSDRYEIHQPSEILEQFQSVVEKTGLKMNRVIPNKHNGGLLLSAQYNGAVNFLGDEHHINLVFYTSHCGKYKTFLSLDTLRIACFNQLPALYSKKNSRFIFSEKHYKNALDIDLIGSTLENIPASIEAHTEKMELLGEKSFSFDYLAAMYKEHYKLNKEAKQYDTKINKLKSIYYNATGQRHLDDNAYKALQAITYLNTHEGRNTQMKEENSLIKGGNDSLEWLNKLLAA